MYVLTLDVSRENCRLAGDMNFSQVRNEGNPRDLRFADLTITVKAIKIKFLMQNNGLENPRFFDRENFRSCKMKVSKKWSTRLVVVYVLTLDVSRENCYLTGDLNLF
jgi:hypothetical protein